VHFYILKNYPLSIMPPKITPIIEEPALIVTNTETSLDVCFSPGRFVRKAIFVPAFSPASAVRIPSPK
jgi:hypothetical protein